ncbi:hypothetical protein GCM10008944_07950 [Cytobacillus oceanisediminis]
MKWPTELVEDIARRRAALYVGAGVSAGAEAPDGSRPPDWVKFLTEANKKLDRRVPSATIRDLIKDRDLLTACELLKSALDESWPEVLKEQFLTPGFKPGPLHKAIHDLDLPVVLTPNFDTIYDRFAAAETSGATVVKNYWDADVPLVLRRKYRAVLKVHGTIDEPSKMVFSRGDYAKMRAENRAFSELVGALFLTHTFVFIGTSLSDPDLRLFLEGHHHSHPQSPPHYMTTPKGEISPHVDESIRRNMNLKLIRYSPDDGHAELTELVNELVVEVNLSRRRMAEAEAW